MTMNDWLSLAQVLFPVYVLIVIIVYDRRLEKLEARIKDLEGGER